MEKETITTTGILLGIFFTVLIPALAYLLKQKDKTNDEKFAQHKGFINDVEDEVKAELKCVKDKGNEIEHNYLKRFEEVNKEIAKTQNLISKLGDKIDQIPKGVTAEFKMTLLENYPTKADVKEQVDTQIKLNKTANRPRKKEAV